MQLKNHGRRRRGSASLFVLLALFPIGALAALVLGSITRSAGEVSARVDRERAFYVAEAGIAHALANLRHSIAGDVGAPDERVPFGGGSYWVSVVDEGLGRFSLTSSGRAGTEEQAIEVVALHTPAGVFHHGLFAGNSSGDPEYVLELGGKGKQADEVQGDVYSGGSVAIEDDATVDGTIRATLSIAGGEGVTGVKQSIPDFESLDYAATADVKVAQDFEFASYTKDDAGGTAWQLPETSPSHIFRKNPSDRMAETAATEKDDYFLEDPYEPVGIDPKQDGSDPYAITVSGMDGKPGPSGNRKLYFIDGNLWLHNYKAFSFEFAHEDAAGIQVTFVAKGNIYFSDNLFYADAKRDGVAFIALQDPAVKDSGNIYWGDPRFGTLVSMSAYMYAEDDFHDHNLDAAGSTSVALMGNMTAGDQVVIERDFPAAPAPPAAGPAVNHTKLALDFDERLSTGELWLPGIPGVMLGEESFGVLSWRVAARP
jgi:hypothetical protein